MWMAKLHLIHRNGFIFFLCSMNIQNVIEKKKEKEKKRGAACLLLDPGMIKGRSFSDITDRKGYS